MHVCWWSILRDVPLSLCPTELVWPGAPSDHHLELVPLGNRQPSHYGESKLPECVSATENTCLQLRLHSAARPSSPLRCQVMQLCEHRRPQRSEPRICKHLQSGLQSQLKVYRGVTPAAAFRSAIGAANTLAIDSWS